MNHLRENAVGLLGHRANIYVTTCVPIPLRMLQAERVIGSLEQKHFNWGSTSATMMAPAT